jgi:uncharacterized protein YxjI
MLLSESTFFVKEHAGLMKLTDVYDLLHPSTGQALGVAKEEPPAWAKYLRLVVNKRLMPTAVNVYETGKEEPVLSVKRPFAFLRPTVTVHDHNDQLIATLKSKVFSLGPHFHVLDPDDQMIAEVKGDWKGWNFKFLNSSGEEIGTVTKKWAGLAKEFLTSADNYVIDLPKVPGSVKNATAILLAAGLAIDTIYKED